MLHRNSVSRTSALGLSALFALLIAPCFVPKALVEARSAPGEPAAIQDNAMHDIPVFVEFKGVHLGMTADEARKKLGDPSEKGDEQDFYSFNEKNSAQVYYDKTKKVYAISISYLNAAGAPPPKEIMGSDIPPKPDGSIYRLVRYPKAGCWVSYNRTSGDDPLVTVTMQKIQQ
jgi:hypothetical protein